MHSRRTTPTSASVLDWERSEREHIHMQENKYAS
jgi:hypothetical protein